MMLLGGTKRRVRRGEDPGVASCGFARHNVEAQSQREGTGANDIPPGTHAFSYHIDGMWLVLARKACSSKYNARTIHDNQKAFPRRSTESCFRG